MRIVVGGGENQSFSTLIPSMLSIQMKALPGIKMSYRLQCLLQQATGEPARGVRSDQDTPTSMNNFIYSLIRNNRNNRRALLGPLLNMFDETAVSTQGNGAGQNVWK